MKLRNIKRFRIILIVLAAVATLSLLAAAIIPPMFTLNNMRSKLETALADQTGMTVKINGDIHFSLMWHATIVAHDITIPNGRVDSVRFAIPLKSLFDVQNAKLDKQISIYGMRLVTERIIPTTLSYNINLKDSVVIFQDKEYEIITGKLDEGNFTGTIRTDQHKYEINYHGDEFNIINYTNNLNINGVLYSDGTARGKISMQTPNANRWFQFSTPRITGLVKFDSNFEWDGGYGLKFHNIVANNFSGNIDLLPNGDKNIQLRAHNVDYDFSFLLNPNKMFYRTTFDLDFYGNLKLADYDFGHLRVNAIGTQVQIQISNIIADDITITGGVIDIDGAHNIMINAPIDGETLMCLFSGTPEIWRCSEFSYGDIHGTISLNNGVYAMKLSSPNAMHDYDKFIRAAGMAGTRGVVEFDFADMAGIMNIDGNSVRTTYKYVRNKTLNWGNSDIKFIPQFMRDEVGDFQWTGEMMEFTPHSGRWKINMYDNYFYVYGENIKDLFPDIDLQSVNDSAYTIAGKYNNGNISELTIKVADHEFKGSASGNNVTIETNILNLDKFINQDFINNYQEREFMTNAPLMQLFGLPVNISLTAKSLIYNDNEFSNFIYALKPNVQTFSITDDNRGNMLATITRDKNNYNIFAQLNRFVANGSILNTNMPINVRDTRITAEINIQTSGQIAHDIFHNMTGEMDVAFDGGYIIGIGVDDFYAHASDITTMNAEYALSNAMGGGESELKNMHLVGMYTNEKFTTTKPAEIFMRHTDAIGNFEIANGQMQSEIQMILRGTSPDPKPIMFTIAPNGARQYSTSQIMQDFDASFLREFVRTHNRF